jgi:hypothetical protein
VRWGKRTAVAATASILMAMVGASASETPARFTSRVQTSLTVAGAWNGIAPCLAAVEGSYLTERNGPKESARIAGFELQGTAPELSAFTALTDAAALQIVRGAGGCRDVNCAARRLFGPEFGPRLLRLAVEYHYLPFGPDGRVSQHWSVAELDEVTAAFADLPPALFPLSDEYRRIWHDHGRLARMAASLGAGVEVVARAGHGVEGIVIGPGWHRAHRTERRAGLVHEIAHEFARARGRSFNWRDAWKAQMAADAARDEASGVEISAYAAASIDEDFAESVTAYRYRAPLLKRTAPHRYAFLKVWFFDGLEYGAAYSCATPSLSRQVHEAAQGALRGQQHVRFEPSRQCAGPAADICHLQARYVRAFRSDWRARELHPGEAAESALSALLSNRRFIADASEDLWAEGLAARSADTEVSARLSAR